MTSLKKGDLVNIPRWGDGKVVAVGYHLCLIKVEGTRTAIERRLDGKCTRCPDKPYYTATLRNVWIDVFGVAHTKEAT